MLLIL
ncbi:hypothetical protein F383_38400 [Gossypium arboreum]|jgi:ribosomal protein L11 methylase PrmA